MTTDIRIRPLEARDKPRWLELFKEPEIVFMHRMWKTG